MRKHFHLIGHFLKNAQSSENICEIFFGPLKNAQLSENACTYFVRVPVEIGNISQLNLGKHIQM